MVGDMWKLLVVIGALLWGNVFAQAKPVVTAAGSLARIDVQRVLSKAELLRKNKILVRERRTLLIIAGVTAAVAGGWWYFKNDKQPGPTKPLACIDKEQREAMYYRDYLLREESRSLGGRFKNHFYDVLVLVLVSMIFNRIAGTSSRLFEKIEGYFSVKSTQPVEVAEQTIDLWKKLSSCLKTYERHAGTFAPVLAKNSELSTFLATDVCVLYGQLIHIVEATMATTLLVSGKVVGRAAVVEKFRTIALSFNHCADQLEAVLKGGALEHDDKAVSTCVSALGIACSDFMSVVGQSDGE